MCYCISCNQDDVVNKEQGSNTDIVEENTQTRQVKVPAHVRNIEREQHQAEAAAL